MFESGKEQVSVGNLPHYNQYSCTEADMSIKVKLPEQLVEQAKRHGHPQHRSVPQQIEYWSQIGKIVEENPDIPFAVIRDIMLADQEPVADEYQFD